MNMASTSSVSCLVLFAFCGSALAYNVIHQEVINVTVYFESYCPDSVKFLTKQLYPTYFSHMKLYMNLTLVPFGKANYTKYDADNYTFTCHHGEKECKGNKVIACTLKKENDFEEGFKFINCLSSMIAANPTLADYPVDQCNSVSKINVEEVRRCAEGSESNRYLAEYGNKTMEFKNPLASVPTVVFNDDFVESEHKMALSDFRQALCRKISGGKPAGCEKSSAVSVQTAILPIILSLIVVSRV